MENEIERLTKKYCSGEITAEQAARLNDLIGKSRRNAEQFRRKVAEYSTAHSSFEAEEAWRAFAAKNETLFTAPRRLWRLHIGGVAAAFAVAAMLAIGLFYSSPAGTASVENSAAETAARVVEYRTGRGEKMNIVLSDGSTVCLNSETTLTVAQDFGSARREIFFDGEGFFNIARDEKHPFVIHCANDDYTVLGTSFNLQSYAKENFAVVTLHTGCLQAKVRKDAIILDPNEQLQIDA